MSRLNLSELTTPARPVEDRRPTSLSPEEIRALHDLGGLDPQEIAVALECDLHAVLAALDKGQPAGGITSPVRRGSASEPPPSPQAVTRASTLVRRAAALPTSRRAQLQEAAVLTTPLPAAHAVRPLPVRLREWLARMVADSVEVFSNLGASRAMRALAAVLFILGLSVAWSGLPSRDEMISRAAARAQQQGFQSSLQGPVGKLASGYQAIVENRLLSTKPVMTDRGPGVAREYATLDSETLNVGILRSVEVNGRPVSRTSVPIADPTRPR